MRNPKPSIEEDWRFVLAKTGKAKAPAAGGASRSGGSVGGSRPTPEAMRSSLMRAVQRKPQAVFKVTSYSKTGSQLRAHLEYISRTGRFAKHEDGPVTVYDQSGGEIHDADELREAGDLLAAGVPGLAPAASKAGRKRERVAMHLMLAMPPTGDPARFELAVRDFLQERFGSHDYLFAFHDDTDNFHAHVAIGMQGLDGQWLRPNRSELYDWRRDWADALERNGIEAIATPALARGHGPKHQLPQLVQMDARDRRRGDGRSSRRTPRVPPTYDAEVEAAAIEARASAWSRLADHYADQLDAEAAGAIRGYLAEHFDRYPEPADHASRMSAMRAETERLRAEAERRHRDAEPAERLRLAIEANDSAGAPDVLRPLTLVEARAAAAKAGLVVPDEVRTKTGLYRAVEQQQREPAKGRIDPAGGPLEEKPLPLARRPAAEPAAAKRKGADRER